MTSNCNAPKPCCIVAVAELFYTRSVFKDFAKFRGKQQFTIKFKIRLQHKSFPANFAINLRRLIL